VIVAQGDETIASCREPEDVNDTQGKTGDSTESPSIDGRLWPGWTDFWESRRGLAAAVAAVVGVGALLSFGLLGDLGIWEPWEAGDVLVAQEYQDRGEPEPLEQRGLTAPSYNWAVPTRDGEPVHRSLLKTWLVSASLDADIDAEGEVPVGTLEWSARAPMAFAILIIAVLGLFWLRRWYETWPSVLSVLAFLSMPAIYLGVHNVAAETLFVATTSGALMAYMCMVEAEGWRRMGWGALFGLGLGLSFLDQRYLGLMIPLATIAVFALTQLPFYRLKRAAQDGDDASMIGSRELAGALGMVAAAAAVVGWALSTGDAEHPLMAPHAEQVLVVTLPLAIVGIGASLAWRTRAVETLRSPAGLVAAVVAAALIVPVLEAYADANPTLLKHGEIIGTIPVLDYALTNTLYGGGFAAGHMHFALWIRQIGFALIPWVALAPLGIGYLTRATRMTDDNGQLRDDVLEPRQSVQRLLLVWIFVSLVLVAGASMYGHFFYPGYFPIAAGIGLMLADADFWRRARLKTVLSYAMGFAAIAIVFMLTKDLERWPARFIELFTMLQEEAGLPDQFTYAPLMDVLRYTWVLLFVAFFFGGPAVFVLAVDWVRDHKTLAGRWLYAALSVGAVAGAITTGVTAFYSDGIPIWAVIVVSILAGAMVIYGVYWLVGQRQAIADWYRGWGEQRSGAQRTRHRARQKADVRRREGWLPTFVRVLEAPSTGSAVIAAVFVLTAGVVLFQFAPQIGHHLSQRSVFETYVAHQSAEQPLYRYRVSTDDTSVYLRGVENIQNRRRFLEMFDQKNRFFAVIRRDDLSSLNKYVRQRYERNIPVLDARSSKLLLVSNQLKDDETDENFVADAIVDGEPEIDHDVTFESNGRQVHPTFDNRLKLLGYSLDNDGNPPSYSWGETATLTTYFEVLDSVPGNQQIFLHVDYPGSRIHGDHYPVGGEFPTSDWLEGDIVKDVYQLKIDPYSSAGLYTMYFGFYRGGSRMKVSPDSAHDGENRIPMGKIRVTGF
jgi:hypothetical protein